METVIVVGAGPVGLVTAGQLARLGVPVSVVDALETPTTESRAVVVHARSLEMLASLGVRDEMLARGRRMRAMEAGRGRERSPDVRVDFTGLATRHPFLLDLAQPDTEEVLARRAAELGVTVRRGVTLTGLAQDDDGVTVELATPTGEESARVGWVVAADGAHSATRHQLGTRLEGDFHGQHFAMADVDVDTSLDRDAIRMFPHPAGLAMLFPLAGDRARIMFMVDDPGGEELTFERVRALAEERTDGTVAVRAPRWLTYFEVHHGQVPQYRHARVLLAGDAAHIHSPAGGQGMNTGIQDAANIAWKLALVARGRAAPELLDSYHRERHPVAASVIRATTRLTDVATGHGVTAALRELAMVVAGHVPALGRTAATQLAELGIEYRDSPLSVQEGHHRHGAARAGERVPDPTGVRYPDGAPAAIEDLLARPGLLVLARSDDPGAVGGLRHALGDLGSVVRLVREAPATAEDVLVDADDALGRALGLGEGGLAVVRPDGYLGLVAAAGSPEVLRRYLVESVHVSDDVPVGP